MKTVYQTKDGSLFDTVHAAAQHEIRESLVNEVAVLNSTSNTSVAERIVDQLLKHYHIFPKKPMPGHPPPTPNWPT